MSLDEYSTETLKTEIERREKLLAMTLPPKIASPDWSALIAAVDKYVDADNFQDADRALWRVVAEAAAAVYGTGIMDYVNGKREANRNRW